MRYVKWAGWFVVILLAITGTTMIYESIEETKALKNTEMMSSTETIIDDKYENEFPGLHLRTETKDTKKYMMSISIPTTEHNEINTPIWEWIDQQKEDFLSELRELKDSSTIAQLNIQLETNLVEEGLYSLVFTSNKIVDDDNEQNKIQPYMVNIKEQKIITLQDIFKADVELSEHLLNLITEKINNVAHLKQTIFGHMLEDALQELDQLKWTVNDTNFILYFNKNEIASGAAGTLTFNIPLEKLATHFQEQSIANNESGEQIEPDELDKDEEKEAEDDSNEEKPTHNQDQKYVALTFDDGPSPTVTPLILKTLDKYGAKGTFFMIGNEVQAHPEIAKQVVEAGHEVANHSYNHPDLTKLGYAAMEKELNLARDKIEQVTGVRPTLIRPPSGAYNNQLLNYANHHNNAIVLWSVDPRDWQSRNATAVYNAIMKGVTSGSIILLHDIYPSTADALPKLLATLSSEGYEFITVSELLAIQESNGSGPYTGTRLTK